MTGRGDELAFVSPKSGSAVSRGAAFGHEAKLLPLPLFLRESGAADWPDILAALRLSEHFLSRDVLVERRADTLAARERLSHLMRRAVA